MGGSARNILSVLAAPMTGGLSLLAYQRGGGDSGDSTTAPTEVPKPPMTEDAVAEAERKLAGTQRKRKGMASTIFTSPAGAPLGGGNVSNIFAQGA